MERRKLIPVKGNNNMFRDATSKAIINTDKAGFEQAKAIKARINSKNERLEDLERNVEQLTELVQQLLQERGE